MIPMNSSCSREKVNDRIRNKLESSTPDDSFTCSDASIHQPIKSKGTQKGTKQVSSRMTATTILNNHGDNRTNRQGNVNSKFYVSELDYHIPDLNVTHDSLDQRSVKSCGTDDGCTVTTGTTIQASNGITARLRKAFKRKNGKRNEEQKNVPVSIAAAGMVDRDNTQTNPLDLQKDANHSLDELKETSQRLIAQHSQTRNDTENQSDHDNNEDDIRDTSQSNPKQSAIMSFFQHLFECCTTDDDIFLE